MRDTFYSKIQVIQQVWVDDGWKVVTQVNESSVKNSLTDRIRLKTRVYYRGYKAYTITSSHHLNHRSPISTLPQFVTG